MNEIERNQLVASIKIMIGEFWFETIIIDSTNDILPVIKQNDVSGTILGHFELSRREGYSENDPCLKHYPSQNWEWVSSQIALQMNNVSTNSLREVINIVKTILNHHFLTSYKGKYIGR